MTPAQRTPLRPQVPPQPTADRREPVPADTTLARLRTATTSLPPGDGIAVCCRALLSAVRGPREESDVMMERHIAASASVLADRLLDSLVADEAGDAVPACWQPLFRLRHHPHVTPPQFALAGLNAHFGHDLPLALLGGDVSRAPQLEGHEREFHRMVYLLTRVEEYARDALVEEREPLNVADPLAHLAGAWDAERAQRDAWTSCQLLRRLSETPTAATEFARQLDRRTGLTGWLLLTPLPRPDRPDRPDRPNRADAGTPRR